MSCIIYHRNGQAIAAVNHPTPSLHTSSDALDLIGTLSWQHNCNRVAIHKQALSEEFFRLSTGIAGEILQKFVNYGCKVAIYGDFSHYTSKPLQDFIYESNVGAHVFFVNDLENALEKLSLNP